MRGMMLQSLVFLLVCGGSIDAAAVLRKLPGSEFPDAKCLDGSPGAYYYDLSPSTLNSKDWVFSLEGGGECVTREDCASRAKGNLGSSDAYLPEMNMTHTIQSREDYNPFSVYNFVYVKYCSGDLHMGQQDPQNDVSTIGGDMYFSGHRILSAIISDLSDHLKDAETIVWSGESAGGMGCFNSLDFVHDKFPDALVVGLPVGGFYFSNESPYLGTSDYPATDYIPWRRVTAKSEVRG